MGKVLAATVLALTYWTIAAGTAAAQAPLPRPALAAPSVYSSAAGKTVFGGLTTDDNPVYAALSTNGRELTRIVAALDLTCMPDRDKMTWVDGWIHVDVSARGNFKASYSDTDPLDGGGSIDIRDTLTGRVNRARTKITGTFRTTWVFRRADGSEEGSCDSGDERFTATR